MFSKKQFVLPSVLISLMALELPAMSDAVHMSPIDPKRPGILTRTFKAVVAPIKTVSINIKTLFTKKI